MKIFITTFALFLFLINSGFSQDDPGALKVPNQDFGLGIQKNEYNDIGFVVTYAFTPSIHIGTQFGLVYDSGYEMGSLKYDGGLNFNFSPFVKYFLENEGNLRPFVMGGFNITSTSEADFSNPLQAKTRTVNREQFYVTVGGNWFPYKSIGVYGGFKFFEFNTDNSQIYAGFGRPTIGIDWWF